MALAEDVRITGAHPPPGRRRPRIPRPSPYPLVAAAFFVVMNVLAYRNNIISDFGQHASAIERVAADPLHPANPLVDLPGTNSPYFSPFVVVLGLIAKVTGLPGWFVLKVWGPVNLLVVLTGVAAFSRTLSRNRWVPVLALAGMMLLWGDRPAAWSGFLSAGALTRNLTFPSTFAIGLTLHTWALTARVARGRASPPPHAVIGACMAMILVIHPITSVGAAAGVGAIVLGGRREWNRRAATGWAVTVGVALLLAALWSYYDVFRLVGDTTVDRFHKQLYGRHLITWYGLSLVGVPALVARWRRDRLDPLPVLYVVDLLIAAYGWFSGHYTYGRIFGLLLLPPQFALAVELTRRRPWSRARRALAAAAALAGCVGAAVQTAAIVPIPFSPVHLVHLTHNPGYHWAADRMAAGDVVLTDDYDATHVLPAYGIFLVSGAWPDPSLPTGVRDRRTADVDTYFSPRTAPAARRRIEERYHVRWVFLGRGQRVPLDGRVVAVRRRTGERLVRLAAGS